MTDAYGAAFERLFQELADETGAPVELLRDTPSSGEWLRDRAAVIDAFTQPHRERAARMVGAMQEAVEQAMVLDRAGKVDWQMPPRRCISDACDEHDGIHSYGDGCALVRRQG